jgi:hypothetical protein
VTRVGDKKQWGVLYWMTKQSLSSSPEVSRSKGGHYVLHPQYLWEPNKINADRRNVNWRLSVELSFHSGFCHTSRAITLLVCEGRYSRFWSLVASEVTWRLMFPLLFIEVDLHSSVAWDNWQNMLQLWRGTWRDHIWTGIKIDKDQRIVFWTLRA